MILQRKQQKQPLHYILLDIDGVLNTKADWSRPFTLNPRNVQEFAAVFRPYSPRILLTSSWRHGFLSKGNPGNSVPVRELEKALGAYGLSVDGILRYDGSRGHAVRDFMRTHPDTICIDDDRSEFDGCTELPGLIFTDSRYGFRRQDARAF